MSKLLTSPKAGIQWPSEGQVDSSDLDFVYIMRKDGEFTMSPLAQKVSADCGRDREEVFGILLEEYDAFFAQLIDVLQRGFTSKGKTVLHLFDPASLKRAMLAKAGSMATVSLDPLMTDGVENFQLARGYYMGGKAEHGPTARPGAESITEQARKIAGALRGEPVVIAEDDICSGASVTTAIDTLRNQGVDIQRVIPGIQIGGAEKLSQLGIEIDPVVSYTSDDEDTLDKIDLGDPRDYLLGASGLVVRLRSGEYGRVPYILPFVSPAARASIPAEIERDFSLKMLEANLEFFNNVQSRTNTPLQVRHMDPHTVHYLHEVHDIDSNAEMGQVITWLMESVDTLWQSTERSGDFQEGLDSLELPQAMTGILEKGC